MFKLRNFKPKAYLTLASAFFAISSELTIATPSNSIIINVDSYTGTIDTPNYLIAGDGDIVQKNGSGTLYISAQQGQTPQHSQNGMSGILYIKEGTVKINHKDAFGNGLKSNAPNSTINASNNYLLMSSLTTLLTETTIDGLSVPIKIDNSNSSCNVLIQFNNCDLTLANISNNNNTSNTIQIRFSAQSGSAHTLTLGGTYTKGTDNDKMIVMSPTTVSASTTLQFAPNLDVADTTVLRIKGTLTLPKIGFFET